MAIFERPSNGGEVRVSVLDHEFSAYGPQLHEEDVFKVLTDLIRMGDVMPITFPGPDGQSVPRDGGELIIAWTRKDGKLYVGVSTT